MSDSTLQTDVIIVGGGVVGLSLACLLAEHPLNVVLVERNDASTLLNCSFNGNPFSAKVSALSRASQMLFKEIDCWQAILNTRACSYDRMHVWDACGSGRIDFDAADIGEPELGHIVEDKVLLHVLMQRVALLSSVTVLDQTKCYSIEQAENSVTLLTKDNQKIHAKLLVGADGANSWVRQQLSIDQTTKSYQQQAIVATVSTETPHGSMARQRFLPSGPLALLPLADDHYCSLVWSTTPEQAERLNQLDESAFCETLSQESAYSCGEILSATGRQVFHLVMRHSERYISQRVVMVGDSIRTIHPLAGQGLNLGLLDAQCLSQQITYALEKGRDIGTQPILRRYERARKGQSMMIIGLMSAFKNAFSTEDEPFVSLRNTGLALADQSRLLKSVFMWQAMGTNQLI